MPACRALFPTLAVLVCSSLWLGCPPKDPGKDPDAGKPQPCTAADDPSSGACSGCMNDTDCAALGTGFHCDAAKKQCFKVCSATDNLTNGSCIPCTAEGAQCSDLGAGYQCNAKTGACLPPCSRDDDCAAFKSGLRCDNATGQCIQGLGCFMDSSCQLEDATSYCDKYGVQCRCVVDPTDKVEGFDGVCRRRHAFCEECTKDEECGVGLVFEPPAECKSLEAGGKKYCLHKNTDGQCGGICGRIPNSMGLCVPQSNSCESVGCTEDKQCPNGKVCNIGKCLCEDRCRWDFEAGEVAKPGCPPGNTCWVDDANLDPSSNFYGAGRCRPPCKEDSECTLSAGNPFGGSRLKCAAEELKSGGMSDKRCRAKGECMDNLECPELPMDSLTIGYCDKGTFVCKSDCRVGQNPITGLPYDDCKEPYACAVGDAGTNYCRLLSCAEQGGAAIACARGQFCCGEDKNDDGVADPCPPADQLQADKCYDLPTPPFCTTCTSDTDCQNPQLPSWLANACPNGSKSPSCSPLPPVCVTLPDGMGELKVCAPSTYNDGTQDQFGRRKDTKGCPATFSARPVFVAVNPDDDGYCQTDADCNVGTDAGRCARSSQIRLPDGGNGKVCVCNVGAAMNQCPNQADAGLTSECRYGANGSEQPCITSVVCTAAASILHQPKGSPTYGCGIP